MTNYRKIKAIESANKKRILSIDGSIPETSGIYVFTRVDENGVRYSYVGQAKHLLTRLAQHLSGYQHIDLSIKKHKLYDPLENPTGWNIQYTECEENKLDELEQYYIQYYLAHGYQSRNKTMGGQGVGKTALGDPKSPKGYHDGLAQGYENCRKYVRTMFEKYLIYKPKGETKICAKKLIEFDNFIKDEKEKEE